MRRKLNNKEIEQARTLHKEGISLLSIAKVLRTSYYFARKAVFEETVDYKPPKSNAKLIREMLDVANGKPDLTDKDGNPLDDDAKAKAIAKEVSKKPSLLALIQGKACCENSRVIAFLSLIQANSLALSTMKIASGGSESTMLSNPFHPYRSTILMISTPDGINK